MGSIITPVGYRKFETYPDWGAKESTSCRTEHPKCLKTFRVIPPANPAPKEMGPGAGKRSWFKFTSDLGID
jgi:hypothetical protein